MKTIHTLVTKIQAPAKFLVPGAMIIALFQFPGLAQTSTEVLAMRPIIKANATEILGMTTPIADAFFGDATPAFESHSIVEKQMNFVSTRKAYPAAYSVVEKHQNTIKNIARRKNVPEDVAIGVALLENGGSETAVSPAGALGVFQLMPGTARSLGLVVNKKVDERKNPAQNIEAGISYLAKNYERFGDWGLSTWAYHAGEGNVVKALKIYAKRNDNIDLPGIKNIKVVREYVEENNITVHKLLSDPAVKEFTKKLNDDSSGYPYKVVATATLFKKGNKGSQVTVAEVNPKL